MEVDLAVVSETDAAHSHESSGDEAETWLAESRPHQRRRRCAAGSSVSATNNEPSSHGEEYNSDDEDEVDMNDAAGPDDLYGKNMDDEDEAWVYKNLRGGQEQLAYLKQQQLQQQTNSDGSSTKEGQAQDPNPSNNESTNPTGEEEEEDNKLPGKDTGNHESQEQQEQNPQLKQALLLKPRTSDAILSCPRCFNTVCMDCQQHERYANQYRAMFVMNIGKCNIQFRTIYIIEPNECMLIMNPPFPFLTGVDWSKRIIYDEAVGGLKLDGKSAVPARGGDDNDATMRVDNVNATASEPDKIPHDTAAHHNEGTDGGENDELYYSVHCSYCQHNVAALDMKDEIYYFFGCIASS